MEIPSEIPVMILPNAILFPQSLLPLYIFEPRYRQMLADSLHTHRMFSVALQRPGRRRETPAPIAGLGLIRASVANKDGTSHLILQGIARIKLTEAVRYKPYRVHRIRRLQSNAPDTVVIDALVAKTRELVNERLRQGLQLGAPTLAKMPRPKAAKTVDSLAAHTLQKFTEQIIGQNDPEQLADMISCALLPSPLQRQTILETLDVENRLKHLIHFLMAEIDRHRKDAGHE
jgi:Lon protease-like protein